MDGTIDVRAVRALAHPLRIELLDRLRFDGASTATLLAQRIGQSSGATSYHLRQLARHGFIEEVPSDRGRQRWWRYRERRAAIRAGRGSKTNRNLFAELLSREAHALDRFLARPPLSLKWNGAAFFESRATRLTPKELDRLRRDIEGLLARVRVADAAGAPKGALPVRLLAIGFPAE